MLKSGRWILLNIGAAVLIAALVSCSNGAVAPGLDPPEDVLEHHKHPSRDGHYIDPVFTPAAAARLRLDPTFNGAVQGAVYAQPLYVTDGPMGKPAIIVATERNIVYALDEQSGLPIWERKLGDPVPLSSLPCGNIDPLGITGTPVVEMGTRTLFLDAMITSDGGLTKGHFIFALSLDDGSTPQGWPIDVSASVSSGGLRFDSSVQNQRAALALIQGTLFVGYGGFYGDCGDYHGWLVSVPILNPFARGAGMAPAISSWASPARGGAIWAPGGVSYDGQFLYLSTGNTFGALNWSGGEAILRGSPNLPFDPFSSPTEFFTPGNWLALDIQDLDLGGTQPVIIDLPAGAKTDFAMALGKDGMAYLLDRSNLGGIGGAIVAKSVASSEIITAPTTFISGSGVMVAFSAVGAGCPAGSAGDLTALTVTAGSPPSVSVTWCAAQNGKGSPIVTTTDLTANPIVWSVGAEGDNRLHGFDGLTGRVIFGGGGSGDVMGLVRRYQSPIVANGSIYVAGDNRIYRFKPSP